MKAVAVFPERKEYRVIDHPEPALQSASQAKVRILDVGICGTDKEIVSFQYGTPPEGSNYLIIGHESLGRVVEAQPESGFGTGDWVVGIVRHPDPVPCASCAAGEWDMCRNGQYTERGIKALPGFAAERYGSAPDKRVKVDPKPGDLGGRLEPTSVGAKAWGDTEGAGGGARRGGVRGAGWLGRGRGRRGR